MKRTWRPTAAGVLCIIAGAIFLVTPLVFALPFVGIIPLVGGIYAFKRRIWGLALAGSICTLFLGIYVAVTWLGFMSDGVQPILTSWLIGVSIIFGIPGILAVVFIMAGKPEFDQARELDRAIELNPDNADAYYKRGDAYGDIGQYQKAIVDYSRAIELKPNDALAYFNRGYAYGEIGEHGKAIADYSKAIDLDPGDAETYYNRGFAYQERGELTQAVSDLERCMALSTDPELARAAEQALHRLENSP